MRSIYNLQDVCDFEKDTVKFYQYYVHNTDQTINQQNCYSVYILSGPSSDRGEQILSGSLKNNYPNQHNYHCVCYAYVHVYVTHLHEMSRMSAPST